MSLKRSRITLLPPDKKEMWEISTVVFVLITAFTSAQDVYVTFLSAVSRLNSNSPVDYYFCCNVVGRYLQWEYKSEPLTGFRTYQKGKVLVDKRLDYTYTATLLSSVPLDNNEAKMDSVLVVSFPNSSDSGQFEVTCYSDRNFSSTTAGNMNHVQNSDVNEEVQVDYIISGTIVSNHNHTHIFMCGVRGNSQLIEVIGSTLNFTKTDGIGTARTKFFENQHTVEVQGILITRETNQTVTLIFITTSLEIVNVSCNNVESWSFALSHEVTEAKRIPETIMYNHTLETMINSSRLPAENIFKPATDRTTNNNLIKSLSASIILIVVLVGIIIIVVTVSLNKINKRKRKTGEVEHGLFPNDAHDSTKSYDVPNDKPKFDIKLSIVSQNEPGNDSSIIISPPLSQNKSSNNSPLTNTQPNRRFHSLINKFKPSKLIRKPPSSATLNTWNEDLSSTTKVDESNNNNGSESSDEDCSSTARRQNNEVEEGNGSINATGDDNVSNNIECSVDENASNTHNNLEDTNRTTEVNQCDDAVGLNQSNLQEHEPVENTGSRGMRNNYNSDIGSQDAAPSETNV